MADPNAKAHKEGVAHEAEHAGEEASAQGLRGAAAIRDGLIGGVHGAQMVATESVHMVRDVASDTVRAVGDVGSVAVDTTRHLLVGVADGVRDILGHIIPFRAAGRHEAGPHKEGQ